MRENPPVSTEQWRKICLYRLNMTNWWTDRPTDWKMAYKGAYTRIRLKSEWGDRSTEKASLVKHEYMEISEGTNGMQIVSPRKEYLIEQNLTKASRCIIQ